MSMPPGLLRALIRATSDRVGLWTPAVETQLLMIAAHESKLGRWLRQTNGPALGIWQMEPATHDDCLANVVPRRAEFQRALRVYAFDHGLVADTMIHNHAYACLMARLQVWRVREILPAAEDIEGHARYAKNHWNTPAGRATVRNYADAYREMVL